MRFIVSCHFRGVRCGWRTKKRATASCVRRSSPSQDGRSVIQWWEIKPGREIPTQQHKGDVVLTLSLCVSLSSITVGTVGRFSVTAALTTSSLCPPHQNQWGSVTPATPSSSSDAPPIQREGAPPRCDDCFKQPELRPVNPPPSSHQRISAVFAARNGPCAWPLSTFDLS